ATRTSPTRRLTRLRRAHLCERRCVRTGCTITPSWDVPAGTSPLGGGAGCAVLPQTEGAVELVRRRGGGNRDTDIRGGSFRWSASRSDERDRCAPEPLAVAAPVAGRGPAKHVSSRNVQLTRTGVIEAYLSLKCRSTNRAAARRRPASRKEALPVGPSPRPTVRRRRRPQTGRSRPRAGRGQCRCRCQSAGTRPAGPGTP